jgi:hypothetical protein
MTNQPTKEQQMELVSNGLTVLDDYDLREVYQKVWIAKLNYLIRPDSTKTGFTYCNESGKLANVMVVKDHYRNGELDYSSDVDWIVDFSNTPREEYDKLVTHLIERFGSLEMFEAFREHCDDFRYADYDDSTISLMRQVKPYRIMALIQWLIEGDIPESYAEINDTLHNLGVAYDTDKFKITVSDNVKVEQWKNGKLKITNLPEIAMKRFKALDHSCRMTKWSDCAKRYERKF